MFQEWAEAVDKEKRALRLLNLKAVSFIVFIIFLQSIVYVHTYGFSRLFFLLQRLGPPVRSALAPSGRQAIIIPSAQGAAPSNSNDAGSVSNQAGPAAGPSKGKKKSNPLVRLTFFFFYRLVCLSI